MPHLFLRVAIAIAIAMSILGTAAPAHAEPDAAGTPHAAAPSPSPSPSVAAPSPSPPVETELRYYAGFTIGIDVIATSLVLIDVASDSDGLGGLGFIGYALGGPIVHAVHGNAGRMLGSLALRVLGGPALGMAVGSAFCAGSSYYCSEQLAGIAVGAVGAMMFDWMISYERVPRMPATASRGFSIAPSVSVHHEAVQLGVLGRF